MSKEAEHCVDGGKAVIRGDIAGSLSCHTIPRTKERKNRFAR